MYSIRRSPRTLFGFRTRALTKSILVPLQPTIFYTHKRYNVLYYPVELYKIPSGARSKFIGR